MDSSAHQHLVVYITTPPYIASDLANTLVQEKLAACVNILPGVRSIYSWKEKICDDNEVLLVVKTRSARFAALQKRVTELHPYDVPEIVALPIIGGHPPYLKWLDDSTQA